MLQQSTISNPNDFKVVSFHNAEDFGFTPEMGCMFDGKPIHGVTGEPGIGAGESMTLPYHVAQRLAINLAKVAMTRKAPTVDQAGIPTGVPLWDSAKLETLKNSYLTDLYSETKPVAMTETDRLMAKVDELNKWKDSIEAKVSVPAPTLPPTAKEEGLIPKSYQDKKEVIDELTKRGIKFDARNKKAELEKLLS